MELILQSQSLIMPVTMIETPGIIAPKPLVTVDSLADPANLTEEEMEIIRVLNPEAASLLVKNELIFC